MNKDDQIVRACCVLVFVVLLVGLLTHFHRMEHDPIYRVEAIWGNSINGYSGSFYTNPVGYNSILRAIDMSGLSMEPFEEIGLSCDELEYRFQHDQARFMRVADRMGEGWTRIHPRLVRALDEFPSLYGRVCGPEANDRGSPAGGPFPFVYLTITAA